MQPTKVGNFTQKTGKIFALAPQNTPAPTHRQTQTSSVENLCFSSSKHSRHNHAAHRHRQTQTDVVGGGHLNYAQSNARSRYILNYLWIRFQWVLLHLSLSPFLSESPLSPSLSLLPSLSLCLSVLACLPVSTPSPSVFACLSVCLPAYLSLPPPPPSSRPPLSINNACNLIYTHQ